MKLAQRITSKVVLAIDALLILFPPFESRTRWRSFDLGYHWLTFALLGGRGAGVNFGALAAEIVILSVIGFTVFVLAQGNPDERTATVTGRLSAFGRGLPKGVDCSVPAYRFAYRCRSGGADQGILTHGVGDVSADGLVTKSGSIRNLV
jgi:hypothetical protein